MKIKPFSRREKVAEGRMRASATRRALPLTPSPSREREHEWDRINVPLLVAPLAP
jgi:hypothetical protein